MNCAPGTGCVGVAILVIRRFDSEMTLSVSLAVLLPLLGSVEPAGAETLAVFVKVPSALSATLAVSVKVALPPAARLTVVLTLPVPLVAPQLDPLEVKQVQLALVNLSGRVSTTGAPMTALGPALETSSRYVTIVPAVTVVTLFDLVMDKSEVGVKVSVSLAELFAGLLSVEPAGAATVAVLVKVPVAVLATVALNVNVAVPPGSRFTFDAMLTVPLADAQLEPVEAVQAHEPMTRLAGMMSVTSAPTTALGPALLTTMV